MSGNRKRSAGLGAVLFISTISLMFAQCAWAQSKYKTLYKFSGGTDGAQPYAGLTLDAVGNLYGTTGSGGEHGSGTVFKLTRHSDGSWTERNLHSFAGTDGASPEGALIFDKEGNLYGTTFLGGNPGCNFSTSCGLVFKLTPNRDGSWTENVLFKFTGGEDGGMPTSGLIFDREGNLYSTTEFGGAAGSGTVFKLTRNADRSWTESVLYSFCSLANCSDGLEPTAGLIFGASGNLYGTTALGGNASNCSGSDCGLVFELTLNPDGSWSESVLYTFCSLGNCSDGELPFAGLISDAQGNLYGTTGDGGAFGDIFSGGTVFKLTPSSPGNWGESVLHSFCSRTNCADGEVPFGSVTFDAAGNLYGTTFEGGSQNCPPYGCGVVFKLALNTKGGWTETVLHTFFDHPGAEPLFQGLIFDTAGNLYGTTRGDTNVTFGSIFEITP
jgi:uncharacterized repeat protein (TIGR03803 family)